jgi:hypothetical protein
MNKITIKEMPIQKTRSGKQKYEIKINCSCGWGTKGNNTFSMEHLYEWANKMVEWHTTKEHQ